ncbi:hypothetical protein FJZ53_04950 [Candidatus Woesearchaeota archaeon]|nr:hypothetical protein [Candidatus Woesearchaeota archaeon]
MEKKKLDKVIEKIVSYDIRSPYFNTRISRKKDMIILHTTQESFENYLKTTPKEEIAIYTDKTNPLAHLELSPHYMVLNDSKIVNGEEYATVLNMVNPDNVAHHAGKSKWGDQEGLNENSLGIEIHGYTNQELGHAQSNSLYALLQYLLETHDIPINRILGHYQVAPERRTDPGDKIMQKVWEDMISRVHEDSLIIDSHQDTIMNIIRSNKDISVETNVYEVDIPRMKKGGYDIAFFALYTEAKAKNKSKTLRSLLECFKKTLKDNEKTLYQIKTVEDMNKLDGRIGIILSVEGASGVGKNLTIEELYKEGLRCLSLTHNPPTKYATGVGGKEDKGLKKQGIGLIKKMSGMGIVLDVSHLNDKSFWDVIKHSETPIIASHSNCYSVCAHKRNLKDDQLIALAQTGGVTGMNFWHDLLAKKNVEGVADHIGYVKKLVGIDHVGLGTDFDGVGGRVPEGLETTAKLKNLTKELVKRGYTNKDIKKFYGENYKRVFEQVWK